MASREQSAIPAVYGLRCSFLVIPWSAATRNLLSGKKSRFLTAKAVRNDKQKGAGRNDKHAARGYAIGSVTVNTAPPPGPDAASTLPLCSRKIALQMLNPNPVPRPGRFVV